MNKRHFLICGEPGIGKSTLIRRLRSHSKAELFLLDEQNRDALYDRLRPRLLRTNVG